MSKFKANTILVLLLIEGMTIANAQEKVPPQKVPDSLRYEKKILPEKRQVPPPSSVQGIQPSEKGIPPLQPEGVKPPAPDGQVPPPPPEGVKPPAPNGKIPPPPPEGVRPPAPDGQVPPPPLK